VSSWQIWDSGIYLVKILNFHKFFHREMIKHDIATGSSAAKQCRYRFHNFGRYPGKFPSGSPEIHLGKWICGTKDHPAASRVPNRSASWIKWICSSGDQLCQCGILVVCELLLNGEQRTKIITSSHHQAQRLKKVLQEAIIGPQSIEDYYPNPWVQRECRALSYSPRLERPLELSDLVEFKSLETEKTTSQD
jgi:hypothetical protein